MQVLRLPMSFFDSQPAGRLLNRFSQDTEATDVAVRETIAWCLTCVGETHAGSKTLYLRVLDPALCLSSSMPLLSAVGDSVAV